MNHPFSPTSDEVEVIPPSPVISTLPRKDMWKSNKGRSSNKISISPLLSKTDVTSQENSFLLDTPDNECSDSPVRMIAGSVGCGVIGSASWRHPLTPPGRTGSTWPQWNTLLHSEHAENKSNPEINIRERMLSMQCKSTDMAQTLFIRDSEVKEMYQVQVVSVLSVWRICSMWVGCAVTVRRWSWTRIKIFPCLRMWKWKISLTWRMIKVKLLPHYFKLNFSEVKNR